MVTFQMFLMISEAAMEVNPLEFWVSPTGSNSWDGSEAHPFQTIDYAQAVVRHVLQSEKIMTSDIIVNIEGGTYQLLKPLQFDSTDGGRDGHTVVYRAASGQSPIISGGTTVTNWSMVENPGLLLNPGVQLWQASVPAGTDSLQLFVNGDRATLAETNPFSLVQANPSDPGGLPAQGVYPIGFRPTYGQIPGVSGIEYYQTPQNVTEWQNPSNLNWADPTKWTNVTDIMAVTLEQWKMAEIPLLAVTPPSDKIPSVAPQSGAQVGLITLQDPAWTNANLFQAPPSGALVAGSSTINLQGDYATSGIQVGMTLSGSGIQPNTTVTSISAEHNQITISNPASETLSSQALTITDPKTGLAITHPGIWSFWRVEKFINAYQFLDQANEWYLDKHTNTLYYLAAKGTNPNNLDMEIPVAQKLIDAIGTPDAPVHDITFQGLTFKNATWLQPKSAQGYVADQAGFHVVGDWNSPNITGHNEVDERTPGNISFAYAQNITFKNNIFMDLGATALDFTGGAQNNHIIGNLFSNISSAAIQVGGVSKEDARPSKSGGITSDNIIMGNIIDHIGLDYVDAAAITVGFAKNTLIQNNSISHTPWSAISLGWGWGLLDDPSYPGAPGATVGMWGYYNTPTIMSNNKVIGNNISDFLEVVFDGGAVYTLGAQGTVGGADGGLFDGTLIENNIAHDKRPLGGGNVFYTDGGSTHLIIKGNTSINNAQGVLDFGPRFVIDDLLNGITIKDSTPILLNSFAVFPLANGNPYGSDIGGCRTKGDILFADNKWQNLWQSVPTEPASTSKMPNRSNWPVNPYYYDPCPYIDPTSGISYPALLSFHNNIIIAGKSPQGIGLLSDLPSEIARIIHTMTGTAPDPATLNYCSALISTNKTDITNFSSHVRRQMV